MATTGKLGEKAEVGGTAEDLGGACESPPASFRGCTEALAALDHLLVPRPTHHVAFIHGSVGAGKSALLAEFARRADERGWTTRRASAGHGPLVPALERIVDEELHAPTLLLVDDVNWAEPGDQARRDALLEALPVDSLVALAGRRPPTIDWLTGPWWRLGVEIELTALDDEDAIEVLLDAGLRPDDEELEAIVEWSAGSPLALTVAAAERLENASWTWRRDSLAPWSRLRLRDRVIAEEGAGPQGLLDLAAVARSVTPALIASALPELDTAEAARWLARRSYVNPVGGGLRVQPAVRAVLRLDLLRKRPDLERKLRRRAVDFLHARAIAGATRCTVDLAALASDSALQSGYGLPENDRYQVDRLQSGDADAVATVLWERGHAGLWSSISQLFENAGEWITVVRDARGAIRGFAIAATPLHPPPDWESDGILGPWLEYAAQQDSPETIVWRNCVDLSDPGRRSPIRSILNTSVVLRSGLDNPRYAYIPLLGNEIAGRRFLSAVGAVHLPELDVDLGFDRLSCHLIDYGPGGLLGAQRDSLYRELRLEPPRRATVSTSDVREALKAYCDAEKLSRCSLAEGSTTEQRARFARATLQRACGTAFGTSERQRFLGDVLRQAYFERTGSHEVTAHELGLARQTYFRSLRIGVDALAEALNSDLRQETSHREHPAPVVA